MQNYILNEILIHCFFQTEKKQTSGIGLNFAFSLEQ